MKKNNEILSEQKTVKYMKFFISLFFLVSVIVKFQPRFFVSPKPFVPLASTGTHVDFFNIFKIYADVTILCFLVLLFMYYISKKDISIDPGDIFAALVSILALASAAFSDYKYVSLWGTYERATGTVFIILIFSLYFISSKIRHDEKDIRRYYYLFGIFVVVNFIYTLIHTSGADLLSGPAYQKFVFVPEQYREMVQGYVMGTLENPNYLSGFAAFLIFFFAVELLLTDKLSYYLGFMSVLTVAIMVFSFSSSGIFSVLLTLPFALYYLYQSRENINGKTFSIKIVSLFALLIPLVWFAFNESQRVEKELSSFVRTFSNFSGYYLVYAALIIILLIVLNKKKILDFLWKTRYYIYAVFGAGMLAAFLLLPVSSEFGQHPPEKFYESQEILDTIADRNYSSLFSKREYMWWYTFDLAKEKTVLGYGMATLVFEYPHTSPFKINKAGSTIVTKPHTHYLEILYGSGIFALIFFLLFFIYIFSVFVYKSQYQKDPFNIAIFLGMMAFLFQGLVNDLEVGSYPLVFIMLGVLVSRLNEIKTENEVEKDVKKTAKPARN